MQPLLCKEPFFGVVAVTQFVILVVRLDQVFDDSARFPEGNISVWIHNGWNTPVGVDCFVAISRALI